MAALDDQRRRSGKVPISSLRLRGHRAWPVVAGPAARRRNFRVDVSALGIAVDATGALASSAREHWTGAKEHELPRQAACKARCARYSIGCPARSAPRRGSPGYYLERRRSRAAFGSPRRRRLHEALYARGDEHQGDRVSAKRRRRPAPAAAIAPHAEQPGMQAIATTAPDLSPDCSAGTRAFARDHEYQRIGAGRSPAGGPRLLAAARSMPPVRARHRSFANPPPPIKLLDRGRIRPTPLIYAAPSTTTPRTSHKEPQAWLADQPDRHAANSRSRPRSTARGSTSVEGRGVIVQARAGSSNPNGSQIRVSSHHGKLFPVRFS